MSVLAHLGKKRMPLLVQSSCCTCKWSICSYDSETKERKPHQSGFDGQRSLCTALRCFSHPATSQYHSWRLSSALGLLSKLDELCGLPRGSPSVQCYPGPFETWSSAVLQMCPLKLLQCTSHWLKKSRRILWQCRIWPSSIGWTSTWRMDQDTRLQKEKG